MMLHSPSKGNGSPPTMRRCLGRSPRPRWPSADWLTSHTSENIMDSSQGGAEGQESHPDSGLVKSLDQERRQSKVCEIRVRAALARAGVVQSSEEHTLMWK
ncbi:jg21961 [Pararge aegeria aegeria]|uniref:Jg21961 protein n=1 Tax=Pararge aegeria aegeria TaxID=348720 RepID=A0A8S4QV70_9NEOP|nr:jg21961 [Pararge aegeria aegeria]